jgi:hypothetical protein
VRVSPAVLPCGSPGGLSTADFALWRFSLVLFAGGGIVFGLADIFGLW